MKPVRKITNGSPHKVVGKFPSTKSPFLVLWESQLERDLLHRLEADPTISAIYGQPFHVSYVLDGEQRRYTPDFLAEGSSRRDVFEVKPFEKTTSAEFGRWKAAVAKVLDKHKYQFIVITEKEIREEPELSNLKWLYRYIEIDTTPNDIRKLTELIRKGTNTLGKARKQCLRDGINVECILHLIAIGKVVVDLSQKLTDHSTISLEKIQPCHSA